MPPARETRQDKEKADEKREAGRLAVQRHRANQHPDQKTCVREQRKEYYSRKKAEREELLRARREKAVQVEQTFQGNGFPTQPKIPTREQLEESKKSLEQREYSLPIFWKELSKPQTDRHSNTSSNSMSTAPHLTNILQLVQVHPRLSMHILWASQKRETKTRSSIKEILLKHAAPHQMANALGCQIDTWNKLQEIRLSIHLQAASRRRLWGTSLITMPLRSPASLSNPRNSFFSQSVNRRFLEVTGKDNLTVFSYSGRVKSPEWRWQLKRADLRHF